MVLRSRRLVSSTTYWNPKDDILGLPHTGDGYKEAKRILEQTYGNDIKVHNALIKELEELPAISSIHRLNDIHDFYNKLSRVVRTLVTMKRLTSAQSLVYTQSNGQAWTCSRSACSEGHFPR